ncbi:MAG: ATP-binding protein [Candidatus Hydrothermarchaeota archaeon]|nr:ATP-binding protein [Candidatus Hydrothermarchaeota archaeon]
MSYIGTCIGESSPTQVAFISKSMPRSGEYVTLEYDGKNVLGMVEALVRGSPSISKDILDPSIVEKILSFEGEDEQYIRGNIKLLGEVETLEIPKVPPPPGTKISRADSATLKKIFGSGTIKLGRLISHPDVGVFVDGNKMVSRHLAILAITGAGKSNAVSVIVDGILTLSGMPVIFDMHSEYANAQFSGVKKILPKLNPIYLSTDEFKILVDVGKEAYVQERYLRKAYNAAREKVREGGKNFIAEIISTLEEIRASDEDFTQSERNALVGVINKVEDFESKYKGLVNPHVGDILDEFEQGKANVVDLGSVDEDYADVIVSHVLRKILYRRKSKKITPAFCILEEAHILAPAFRSTLSKYWIDRIAREGRKFGVGLCLVSQRPKSLDTNSLSQANNTIIMRLVEPSDQRHVQQASERLSDDLLSQLTSLNIGEAVVLGLMTKIPALVKIDKFEGKLGGGDPDIVGEWQNAAKNKKKKVEKEKKEVDELYGGMVTSSF